MQGIPGIAAKTFDVVAEQQANVLMISQASSENNICFVLSAAEAPRVVAALRSALEFELMRGHIDEITAEQQVAIVAAVGDRMRGTPGIAATVFGALGNAGVNVIAISQGSSERNISLVVTERDAAEAGTRHPSCVSAGDDFLSRSIASKQTSAPQHERRP